jgi:hypothetical protein
VREADEVDLFQADRHDPAGEAQWDPVRRWSRDSSMNGRLALKPVAHKMVS